MTADYDIKIVIIAHLDDEQCIEPIEGSCNKLKIRLNDHLKSIPELYSQEEDHDSEYIDGFRMKFRFTKSRHMSLFTKEKDRLIEITEPIRRQPYIEVSKHYPLNSFDLRILSIRLSNRTMFVNDWWKVFKTFIRTSNMENNEKLVQLLCAPAFNVPLTKRIARQAGCLIEFYDMFKSCLFSIARLSSTSFLSTISHVFPAIQVSFRPKIMQWFDDRIQNHKRLKNLLNHNCLCLVACGSKKTTFQYDFSLFESYIIEQFNASERQLYALVKKFTVKHLNCSLNNYFLRTSVLWICEIHDLEYYHDIFEVWVSFMRDVGRKAFLSHYFLENVNVYEEHSNLESIINTIDYKNIDLFVEKLEEELFFPHVNQYNDRMKILIAFFESQPVLAFKMKMAYNVLIKSQFLDANNSLHDMCSIICHLSFLEDDNEEYVINFWSQQWQQLFLDFDRDDIVLQQPSIDCRPDELAQKMTASVYKLIQMDLIEMINSINLNQE